jgi:hypothetical protein
MNQSNSYIQKPAFDDDSLLIKLKNWFYNHYDFINLFVVYVVRSVTFNFH